MEEAVMRIHAHIGGGSSVGISGQSFSFDFPLCLLDWDDNDSLRQELRDRFDVLIHVLADAKPNVWFSDECPDCLSRLQEDGFCHDPYCMDQL